jgi:hypothetical protein
MTPAKTKNRAHDEGEIDRLVEDQPAEKRRRSRKKQ